MKIIRGIAASPGIAIGAAFQFRQDELRFERRVVGDPAAEWRRFQSAAARAGEQLAAVCAGARDELGEEQAAIFEAHLLMLEDPELLAAVQNAIEERSLNAEAALSDAAERYAETLEALDDEYLRARAADVRDVAGRVLRILLGREAATGPDAPAVVVARDLTPSDTILMDKSHVLGFCTAEGGPTAHTAILARTMGLPAVVGAGAGVLSVAPGATVVLDGTTGCLVVEPDEATLASYRQSQAAADQLRAQSLSRAGEPAVTRDGRRVEVVANIGSVDEARAALDAGAEGVGLLRTEFLYLGRASLPGEEEQYRAYRAILEAMGSRPVILRTLDIGGDKELPYLELAPEPNPFLGVRAIRLSLARPDLLHQQLRAALRAAPGHNLKIMFPMVATVAEVRAARQALGSARDELQAEGQPLPERVEVGIMVETPAAAVMADRLAREVDFFSIGTNDLSQYTFAADRTNARVAALADALQPAVLRLVARVIAAAHAHGKWVGLCGELAGEPLAIPILLGLGLDEFSMNPPAILLAKELIRSLTAEEAQDLANAALDLDDAAEVRALVRARVPGLTAPAGE